MRLEVYPGRLARAFGIIAGGLASFSALAGAALWENHDRLEFLFLFVSLLSASALCLGWREEVKLSVPRWWVWGAVLLTVLGAYLRFVHLADLLFTPDEDINNGRLLFHPATAQAAAWVQQPPFYYYLSLLGQKLVGVTPVGIRLFSCLLAVLCVPLFALLLLRTCRNSFLALIGAAFFAGNPWLLKYAVEGRPYTGGVFFLLVYLHACLAVEPSKRRSWAALAAANILFFLSISLQPVLIAGLFSLAWGLAARKARWIPFASLLVALVVFIPFHLSIMEFRETYLRPHPSWHSLRLLAPRFIHVCAGLSENAWLLPLAALPVFLFFFRREDRRGFAFAVSVTALLFPLSLFTVFGTIVNFSFYHRYLLIGLPLYVAALAYGLDALFSMVTIKSVRKIACGALLLAAGMYLWNADSTKFEESERKFPAFYDWLESDAQHGDWAFMFALSPGKSYAFNGFPHQEYYSARVKKVRIASEWGAMESWRNQALLVADALEEKWVLPRSIYLVTDSEQRELSLAEVKLGRSSPMFYGVQMSEGAGSIEIAKLAVHGDPVATMKDFFLDIHEAGIPEELKWRAREALAGIAILEKDCRGAQAYLNLLSSGRKWSDHERLSKRVREQCPIQIP